MNIKQYQAKVRENGCIICKQPGEIHHPRFSCGIAQKASDWLSICLCHYHHRTGSFGQAIHNGKATFEKNYGKEADLLAKTIETIMTKF